MKTEIKKPFTHGFKLTEQELLRINEVMMQQMRNETKDDISCPVPGKIDSERSKPERDQQKWQRRINSTTRSSSLKS
jgi:hypothetical protein